MVTREKIAAIDRECEEQHISQQKYLDSHGIARHQYYRWKRRYREEDELSLVPARFVPMMPGAAPAQPAPEQAEKELKKPLHVNARASSFMDVPLSTR